LDFASSCLIVARYVFISAWPLEALDVPAAMVALIVDEVGSPGGT
jgi:hypothetical protein